MTSERSKALRIGAIAASLAAVVVAVPGAGAETTTLGALEKAAASAPAMQGHDAEARMRDPDAEDRWRRLFFEPAGREEGEAQVSCDHRIAKRPDVDGGAAAVVIAWDPATGRVLLRRWEIAAGASIDLDAITERLVAAAPAGSAVDGLAFRRCR